VKIQFIEFDGFFTTHQRDLFSSLVINKFIYNACSHAGSHVNATGRVCRVADKGSLPVLSELTILQGRSFPF
jgi:hypothetical protein